jgi:hypothetical protein
MPRLGTSLETYASQEAHDWLQDRAKRARGNHVIIDCLKITFTLT